MHDYTETDYDPGFELDCERARTIEHARANIGLAIHWARQGRWESAGTYLRAAELETICGRAWYSDRDGWIDDRAYDRILARVGRLRAIVGRMRAAERTGGPSLASTRPEPSQGREGARHAG